MDSKVVDEAFIKALRDAVGMDAVFADQEQRLLCCESATRGVLGTLPIDRSYG